MRKRLAGCLAALLATAAPAGATVYPSTTFPAFQTRLGVNTHLNFGGTSYTNYTQVENMLSALKIKRIRDNDGQVAEINRLYSIYGIEVLMTINNTGAGETPSPIPSGFAAQMASTYGAAVFAGVAGTNEVYLNSQNWGGYNSVSQTAAFGTAYMTSMHTAFRNNSAWNNVPIVMFSTGDGPPQLNNMAALLDLGDWHDYAGGDGTNGNPPYSSLLFGTNALTSVTPGKPHDTTEAGYCSSTGNYSSGYFCTTTPTLSADYTLDIWCDAYLLGISTVYIYELLDENNPANDSNAGQAGEDSFGLATYNYSLKPAGTAIANMMTILNDTGTAPTNPPSVSATVSGSGNNVISIAKSNGTAQLIVWQESGSTSTTITVPTATSLTLYDPTVSTSAQQTIGSGTSITFTVTNHPMIVTLGTPVSTNTPSPSGTIINNPGGANIIDNAGNTWNLVNQGGGLANQIIENGTILTATQFVTILEFIGGNIWQYNGTNWYESVGGTGAFTQQAAGPVPTSSFTVSPDGTLITGTTSPPFTDQYGNVWGLATSSTGLQVTKNGVADTNTSYVTKLEFLGGNIYQENTANNWYVLYGGQGSYVALPPAAYAAPIAVGIAAPITKPYLTDEPAGTQTHYLQLVASGGVITATGANATGSGTATINMSGTLVQINQALQSLKFSYTAGVPSIALSYGESATVMTTTQVLPVAVNTSGPGGTAGQSYAVAGRSGYLLNSGYLSTSGSQIIDASGNPVRIASVGWNNGDSSANLVPDGLYAASYTTIIDAIKADGFNTIRLPYCDVLLTATTVPSGKINYTLGTNSALSGKSPIQVMDAIVTYAGSVGLKIIIDHHNNEGGNGGGGGQQGNGIWYDSGGASDGTDGSGNTGTVTQAIFQSNWVSLATRYAGNSTVIGFDLTNEPTAYGGKSSWGDGASTTDIRMMYQTVGNAILSVDPGVLIICEGPQNYNGQFASTGVNGSSSGNPMPYGDISLVPTKPVTLNIANKVVYSIHVYPYGISGVTPDTGATAIARYNYEFGFLYIGSYKAPVWIGEMGGSLLAGEPDTTSPYSLTDQQAWATQFLSYMNGGQTASGGPAFTTSQQPVSGSWWVFGQKTGQAPDGTQSAWGTGNYRTGQQAVTDLMLFNGQ